MPLNLNREPKFKARKPRLAAFITTAILLPDDREVRVDVRNISTDGFMAIADAELPAGCRFGVDIPGRGIVRGEVRWADGEVFGARFDRPLSLHEVGDR
ncbi:MAG: PilZ domain-containing protein [Allosphingosinicella sp.]